MPKAQAFIAFLLLTALAAADDRCIVHHETGPFDVCQARSVQATDWMSGVETRTQMQPSRIRLVKFDGPIHASQRQGLIDLGAEILDYLPRHAYVVRMDPGLDGQARRLAGVVAVGPLPPALKIGQSVTESIRLAEFSDTAMPLKINLWPGKPLDQYRDALRALTGLSVVFEQAGPRSERLVANVTAEVQTGVIVGLAAMDAVAAIDVYREPVYLNSQGGWLHQSGTSGHVPLFDQGIFGCGQTIGVLDSGVDFGHCSFIDPTGANPPISECDEGANCPAASPDPNQRTTSLYYKWSFAEADLGDAACNPALNAGHGTHVAASAVGNRASSPADCEAGTSPGEQGDRDGAAPGARLIAQEMGEGLEYLNQLGGSLYHAGAIAHAGGARIHNNSWGVPCFSQGTCNPGCTAYGALARDADFLAWDYPDLAVFVAAGNAGNSSCAEQVGAPANAKNIFSIGANNRGTGGENVAGFSSRGPIIDGRIKPDLMAQGSGIISAASSGDPGSESCATCTMSGTSMASPTAAGLAALVREYLERGFYPSGKETPADAIANPSSALVKAIMINSARFMTGAGGGEGPNQNQGFGRITLDDALHFTGDPRRLFLAESKVSLQTGDLNAYLLEVDGNQPLKITLAWTDYPAAIGAGIHLVNQLRLEVEAPDGQVWTQKISEADRDPFQGTGDDQFDDRNNVHQIHFQSPQPGIYEVRIKAIHVPMGDGQAYALAVNGALQPRPGFNLRVESSRIEVCRDDPAEFTIGLLAEEGFDEPVSLAITEGLPSGVQADFSVNPVVPADPPAESVLSIDSGQVDAATHTITLTAESQPESSSPLVRSRRLDWRVDDPLDEPVETLQPVNGSTKVSALPTLSWTEVEHAAGYRVQLAADPDFDTVLVDEMVTVNHLELDEPLPDDTPHFWRVAGVNACGQGEFSPASEFRTLARFCSTPNLTLPSGGQVSDVVSITTPGYVGWPSVALALDFDWPGDLVITLEQIEAEVVVQLMDRPGRPDGRFGQGCGTAGIDLVLADGEPSVQDIVNCSDEPPGLAGRLGPAKPLDPLVGQAIAGDWQLTIEDVEGLEDDGQLLQWCLQLSIDEVSRILFRDRFE